MPQSLHRSCSALCPSFQCVNLQSILHPVVQMLIHRNPSRFSNPFLLVFHPLIMICLPTTMLVWIQCSWGSPKTWYRAKSKIKDHDVTFSCELGARNLGEQIMTTMHVRVPSALWQLHQFSVSLSRILCSLESPIDQINNFKLNMSDSNIPRHFLGVLTDAVQFLLTETQV